jgi:DNA integrity scanning protein DisA with diadenylate cyclase activity
MVLRRREDRVEDLRELLDPICSWVAPELRKTLEQMISLAIELSMEGREGRKVGTMFVIGDSDLVLSHSRRLILDPLYGHPEEQRMIGSPEARATLKALAQLDGAFVLSSNGVARSAARIIDMPAADLDFPMGLGSRHYAAASISKATDAVAVVLSKSAVIRVFLRRSADRGDLAR